MSLRRNLPAVIAFVALILLCVFAVNLISGAQSENELAMVRQAVKSAAVTCYAVEGAYPPALDYLRENYGLSYDEERYIVSYDGFASNLMPDIRVLERGVTE